jgi:hypothetical protein
MAFLATEAFRLGHGQSLDADFVKRLLHLVQLERFDDGFNLLHVLELARKLRFLKTVDSAEGEAERYSCVALPQT